MKKIALFFYSCSNLGDDLFVKVFGEHFPDCKIRLIANPRCVPNHLTDNMKLHPHSFTNLLFGKIQSVFGETSSAGKLAKRCNDVCFRLAARMSDAYVYVGGSVFMEHAKGIPAIDFSTSDGPEFGIESTLQKCGNSFVVGANLGPVYSDTYWQKIRGVLESYTHVCLRDWASYSRVQELPHVQYAPDVLFLVPEPQVFSKAENVVISVVDMSRHTADEAVISAYYRLIADAIMAFSERKIPVTMVSFCEWEGDAKAIDRALSMVPEGMEVSRLCYREDMQQILDAIAGATYVIASRFHSMILGVSFGKPVYPIAYNCKTEHYLQDLNFSGRYANLENLLSVTVEDVLYNYDNRIIADCTEHKKHAKNQFRALRQFLKLEDRETVPH